MVDGDYVLGAVPVAEWQCCELAPGVVLSVSPGLRLAVITAEACSLALVGWAYRPMSADSGTEEIAAELADAADPQELVVRLQDLAGCYVVVAVWKSGKAAAFTDAASLRKVYYPASLPPAGESFLLSSSAELLARELGTQADAELLRMNAQKTVVGSGGYLPAGLSVYPGVLSLLPDHYLDLVDFHPVRHYPDRDWGEQSYAEGVEYCARILRGGAIAAVREYGRVEIAMTAGIDSRTTLAAFCSAFPCGADHVGARAEFGGFTFWYPYLPAAHPDVAVANAVCRQMGVEHRIIEIDRAECAELRFRETFGTTAAMVNSNLADVFRCFYRLPSAALTPAFMRRRESLDGDSALVCKALERWFEPFSGRRYWRGYDLFDLFYWEIRISGWAAKGFSGHQTVPKLNIYNSQRLLDTVLRIQPRKRRLGIFSRDLIALLCPELNKEPINPAYGLNGRVKKVLKNLPGMHWLQYLYFLLR